MWPLVVLVRENESWEHLRPIFTKQMYQESWNEAEECYHTDSSYPFLAATSLGNMSTSCHYLRLTELLK